MLLGSSDKRVLLINAVENPDYLLVGLFFSEPTQEDSVLVEDPDKTRVYKVFLPVELKKAATPMTAINIQVSYEKIQVT